MKRYTTLFLGVLVLFCTISCNSRSAKTETGYASNDSSVIKEKSLIALGQLWGFLKYHHPAVANGNYDWDMELLKMVPLVLEAKKDSLWKKILDDWLDDLPPVVEHPDKKLPDLEVKVKPDYGELFNEEYFFSETIGKIRRILNHIVITSNHYVNVDTKQWGQLDFPNESSYAELLYPDLSYRLLSLFRFWNIVNYFFPYRELCDQKWSEVLVEMLPDFVSAKNQEQYFLACLEIAVKLNDSHVYIQPNNMIFYL